MTTACRILHLEDNPRDADIVLAELGLAGEKFDVCSVRDRAEFEAALAERHFDLIISDYNLPNYDALAALATARARLHDVPFILVSGAVGEERVVELLRAGVTDYVLKHNLDRLLPTVMCALIEADERRKRRDMEEALRQSEERLREHAEMLNQAHDSIVLTDLDGRITYWNAGAERLYGFTAAEVTGRVQDEFCTPGEAELFRAARLETIARGAWNGEMLLTNKLGETLLVESHRTLIRDAVGRPKGCIAISVDITERKKLETQLLRAQRMESIGTLAGGIAHDLNNVLGPILLCLPLLRDSLREERDIELLEQMEVSARRGAAIVRQVLTFARGADGERVPVQIRHLITETRKILGETFPRSVEFDFNAPPGTWIINGDPTQLQQVLMNLCVNALDAMGDDGRLGVETENVILDEHLAAMNVGAKPGPYVAIRVSDTGTGIPEENRERIFDPFFTTKPPGKGTGLGLATVVSIVKSHGGFLHLDSQPGKGTTFKIYLPAEPGTDTEVPDKPASELPRGNGETILLVDDEPTILNAVKRSLRRFDYNVLTAHDGADALALYVQHKSQISVVLSDMIMPVLDGAATARALKSINPHVKIILSSGLATDGGMNKADQAGVRHFLRKPYSVESVLKLIRQVIDEPA